MFARNVLALGALAIVSVTAALAFGPQRKVMPKPKPKPPMKIVFASVKPILDAKCVMCHSGPHPKHNLLLNSYANVMKGDKLIVDLSTSRARMEAGTKGSPGRVQGLFVPSSMKEKDAEAKKGKSPKSPPPSQ